MAGSYNTTRTELLDLLGDSQGWGTSYSDWSSSTADVTRAQRVIDHGLHLFYKPEPLPGERAPHDWSFNYPSVVLPIGNGAQSITLPDDFGGFQPGITELSYRGSNNVWHRLSLCAVHEIYRARQGFVLPATMTGPPQRAAWTTTKENGDVRQSIILELFPTSDGDYQVELPYFSNPFQLGADQTYPLGGQPHADAIREAVMAAGENMFNDLSGFKMHNGLFKRALYAAVWHDRKHVTAARRMGHNLDHSVPQVPRRVRNNGLATYNGVAYPGNTN